MIPAGRFGQPEAIATTVLFLASADVGYVTGTELFVHGSVAQGLSPNRDGRGHLDSAAKADAAAWLV